MLSCSLVPRRSWVLGVSRVPVVSFGLVSAVLPGNILLSSEMKIMVYSGKSNHTGMVSYSGSASSSNL